jgi:hypothetical protein
MRNPFIWLIVVGSALLYSCEKKTCVAVEDDNPLLSITLFQEKLETYIYASSNDTVTLVNGEFERTETYVIKTWIWEWGEEGCRNYHSEKYESLEPSSDYNEEFKNIIEVSFPDAGFYRFRISIFISTYHLSYPNRLEVSMEFNQGDLQTQIEALLIEEILIGGAKYNNVLIFEDCCSNNSFKIIVRPNKGLIAFFVNDELYQLVE